MQRTGQPFADDTSRSQVRAHVCATRVEHRELPALRAESHVGMTARKIETERLLHEF